jgi:DNA-binding transcriptional ArsR family regulator
MPRRFGDGIELLADPTRRRIVALIAVGTSRPSLIADEVGLSRPAISRQLRILTKAGLIRWIRSRFDRRGRLYRVEPTMRGPIIAWLAGVEIGRRASWLDGEWSPAVDAGSRDEARDDSGSH